MTLSGCVAVMEPAFWARFDLGNQRAVTEPVDAPTPNGVVYSETVRGGVCQMGLRARHQVSEWIAPARR